MKQEISRDKGSGFERKLELKNALERLYFQYNRRQFVCPDPLGFLYLYEDIADREIAGIIASSLAVGKVDTILRSVSSVLSALGSKPSESLLEKSSASLRKDLLGFKHRWIDADAINAFLGGVKHAVMHFGSLNECFLNCLPDDSSSVLPALAPFAAKISSKAGRYCSALIPDPQLGSACKRINLFLRWMVRNDDVDPGGWRGVEPSMLIIPLDTHMHRISLRLGLTKRRQADMKTALEVTSAFKEIAPDDPVRYDFVLTRLGIHPGARGEVESFICAFEGSIS